MFKDLPVFVKMCASLCASHPLLPALQHSAEVLEAVELLQKREASFPQLWNLLLPAPRLLPQAAHQPAQIGQWYMPVGGTLPIVFHLQWKERSGGSQLEPGSSSKCNCGCDGKDSLSETEDKLDPCLEHRILTSCLLKVEQSDKINENNNILWVIKAW